MPFNSEKSHFRRLLNAGLISLAFVLCGSSFSRAADLISPAEFRAALEVRIGRVTEFEVLREWGAEHDGVRIWAGGGTAAGIAHYVKEDLEREAAMESGLSSDYSDVRYGYNYFDIYRSTQDADIVIDADEETAQALEAYLKKRFPYLQGSKSVWEVRLLRSTRGTGAGHKNALLGDPDFRNQNTDSHSTGLVEITIPPKKESIIRDAFDWENQENPRFLTDVLHDRLHYYENPLHQTTSRFKNGWNPEILSVIRTFTKSFQYGPEIEPADEPNLRRFIAEFDPFAPIDSLAAKYLTNNGMKLFRHAQDLEYAWNTLERFGFRKKLIQFAIDHDHKDLATLLEREPLRTYPIGKGPGVPGRIGSGKTADELNIREVAHETTSFAAYENMTVSRRGKPNTFISRKGITGESAEHGDGFYTKEGKRGARGTGITIRFKVDPNAVDGLDFYYLPDENFIIFVNASAIRVIDESLGLSPARYFELLLSANDQFETDRGLLEKIRLKANSFLTTISTADEAAVVELMRAHVLSSDRLNEAALEEWFRLPMSRHYPDIVTALIKRGSEPADKFLTNHVLNLPGWEKENEWRNQLSSSDRSCVSFEIITSMGKNSGPTLSKEDEALVERILKRESEYGDKWVIHHLMRERPAFFRPDWLKTLIDRSQRNYSHHAIIDLFSEPNWRALPGMVSYFFEHNSSVTFLSVANKILNAPDGPDHPEWVEFFVKNPTPDIGWMDEYLFSADRGNPQWAQWANHPRFKALCRDEKVSQKCIAEGLRREAAELRCNALLHGSS